MRAPSILTLAGTAYFLTLVACSAGGIQTPPGVQCVAGFAPAAMDVAPAQKLSLDDKANKSAAEAQKAALPPGKYTYASADLIYTQLKTASLEKPLIVQMHEGTAADGTPQQGVGCVRNARVNEVPNATMKVDGVTDIVVNNAYEMTVTKRTFSLNLGNTISAPPVTVDKAQPRTSADAIFKTSKLNKPTNYFIVKNSETDYEIRSEYPGEDGTYKYYLSVHMNYTK